MPNHVINEVIFTNQAALHPKIIAETCDCDGKVDFALLLPMPLNVWRGNCSAAHDRAFGAHNIGLDWARRNWGTKWNAYGHIPIESGADELILRFQTAWTPPRPWLVALFNRFGEFRYHYLSEGEGRAVSGRFWDRPVYGPCWNEESADDAIHRRLHLLLFGCEEFEADDGAAGDAAQ